jgi:hypothetical protein
MKKTDLFEREGFKQPQPRRSIILSDLFGSKSTQKLKDKIDGKRKRRE